MAKTMFQQQYREQQKPTGMSAGPRRASAANEIPALNRFDFLWSIRLKTKAPLRFVLLVVLAHATACQSSAEIGRESAEKQQVANEAAQRKAFENMLPSNSLCPDFGTLKLPATSPAIFNTGDGPHILATPGRGGFPMSIPEWQYAGALEIRSDQQLSLYLSSYMNICQKDSPPFIDKIPAARMRAGKISILQGLNPAEVLDQTGDHAWRNGPKERDGALDYSPDHALYLLAWLNARENPGIGNSWKIEGDEFAFQAQRPTFENIRRRTYVLVDDARLGEYDFARGCFPLDEKTAQDSPLHLRKSRVFYEKSGEIYHGYDEYWWPQLLGNLCIKIPPEDARVFKDTPVALRQLIVLFHVRPQTTNTIKRFVAEPIRYFAMVGDKVYKN